MGLEIDFSDGQTPLDEDEKEGLLISTVSTRSELDEFEQLNIEEAILWTIGRSIRAENILTEEFIRNLHKRMYGKVWKWSGEFRTTNKNIGVDKWNIPTELRCLLDDVKYWIANKTYLQDEIAIRFKHRLVSIHCFANGNGRHSRLMADIIIDKIFKLPVFSWGSANLVRQAEIRKIYWSALRNADNGIFESLIQFARS